MKDLKAQLPPLVEGFSANILAYAVLLAAIATITMALLELVKAVFHMRYFYNKFRFEKWLKYNMSNVPESIPLRKIYRDFLTLTVGDPNSGMALFDQSTEKMMGQIQATANIVLDYPTKFIGLYMCFVNVHSSNRAENPIPDKEESNIELDDAHIWLNYSQEIYRQAASAESIQPSKELQEATQARARLDHYVNRKLDAFQSNTDFFWARLNQTVAITGAAIFIASLLTYIGTPTLTTIFLSVAGGMISPFAKDVVTALTGLRTKP